MSPLNRHFRVSGATCLDLSAKGCQGELMDVADTGGLSHGREAMPDSAIS